MNIWNKVFLGVIIATAIVVLVLTALEMKIRGTGLRYIADLQKKIDDTKSNINKITVGTAPAKSLVDKSRDDWSFEELRNALRERYQERGRVWFGHLAPGGGLVDLPPALQQIMAPVVITGPMVPNEAGTETEVAFPEHLRGVVYVFEQGDEENPGKFLARFNVDSEPTPVPFRDEEENQKTGYQIRLITIDPIDDDEIDQVLEARPNWALYMAPPIDRIAGIFDQLSEQEWEMIPLELRERFDHIAGIFVKLTEQELEMVPPELRERFQSRLMLALTQEHKNALIEELKRLRDDPRETLEKKERYRRIIDAYDDFAGSFKDPEILVQWEKVRANLDDPEAAAAQDLALALDWLYLRLGGLRRDIEIAESNTATNKTVEENAKEENKELMADAILEERRLEAMQNQRKETEEHLTQTRTEIDRITLQIEKLQTINAALLAKIAEAQLKATEQIEKRVNDVSLEK